MEPGNLNHRWKSLRGCLHSGRRSGLSDPKAKVPENLFDPLFVFNRTDDLHPSLTFRTGQGSTFPDQVRNRLRSFESGSPNSFDTPWMILPVPGCKVSIHPGFVFRILVKLVQYLESIRYWEDKGHGMWEEKEEVQASSIGACLAGNLNVRARSQGAYRERAENTGLVASQGIRNQGNRPGPALSYLAV